MRSTSDQRRRHRCSPMRPTSAHRRPHPRSSIAPSPITDPPDRRSGMEQPLLSDPSIPDRRSLHPCSPIPLIADRGWRDRRSSIAPSPLTDPPIPDHGPLLLFQAPLSRPTTPHTSSQQPRLCHEIIHESASPLPTYGPHGRPSDHQASSPHSTTQEPFQTIKTSCDQKMRSEKCMKRLTDKRPDISIGPVRRCGACCAGPATCLRVQR